MVKADTNTKKELCEYQPWPLPQPIFALTTKIKLPHRFFII